jgi:hypothetical protein
MTLEEESELRPEYLSILPKNGRRMNRRCHIIILDMCQSFIVVAD